MKEIYNGTHVYHEKKLIDYLNESLKILLNDSNNSSNNLNSNNNKMFTYGLLESRKLLNNVNNNNNDDYNWQPLVQVIESWDNLIVQELVVNNNLTDEEIILDPINCLTGNDCKGISETSSCLIFNITNIIFNLLFIQMNTTMLIIIIVKSMIIIYH